MRTVRWTLALALILTSACGGGVPDATRLSDSAAGSFSEAGLLQSDGPLGGLALTGYVDRSDPAIRPTLAFTSNDTEATAVVGLGDVAEGSSLTVTWYQLTGIDERELLFSHEIDVGPGGEAFSQGIAAGGLAPGAYETVATMDEYLVHTPWIVREAKATPTVGAKAQAVSAASEDEPWNTPESGDSGWYEPQTPDSSPPPPGPCEVASVHTGFDPLTDATGSVYWVGQCTHMGLAATISGPPQEVASKEITSGSQPFLPGTAGLCELPGASDLPGTVVHWSATGSDGATASASFTAPDYGETLEAIVQAAEGTPSRVDPGYKIELRAIAIVMPPALGIEKLSLFAGEELIQSVGNASGATTAQPCDSGRYGAVNRASYTVPSDPPPVIEICAEAVGFDGTQRRNCIDFYTGEVWKGTLSATHTVIGSCRFRWSGPFTLTVDADGNVTGEGSFEPDGCNARGGDVPITGRFENETFELNFSSYLVTDAEVTITSPNHATGTGEYHDHYNDVVARFEMDCASCE